MTLSKLIAPAALAFNMLAVPAAQAHQPKDFKTLTPNEQADFIVCQLEGASLKSRKTITQEFENALELLQQGTPAPADNLFAKELEQALKILVPREKGGEVDEIASLRYQMHMLLVINYLACGVEMNIDLNTFPTREAAQLPNNAPQPH